MVAGLLGIGQMGIASASSAAVSASASAAAAVSAAVAALRTTCDTTTHSDYCHSVGKNFFGGIMVRDVTGAQFSDL